MSQGPNEADVPRPDLAGRAPPRPRRGSREMRVYLDVSGQAKAVSWSSTGAPVSRLARVDMV